MASFWRENLFYLNRIEKKLARHGILSPRAEAESLVRHFSRSTRVDFFTGQKAVTPHAKKSIEFALTERFRGQPLSTILKEAYFCGHRFLVTRDTLIPRPETELLVEEAVKILNCHFEPSLRQRTDPSDDLWRRTTRREIPERSEISHSLALVRNDNARVNILDIGTGTGAIAVSLTIRRPDCKMTALDISPKALRVARKNIRMHGLEEKIRLLKSDLFGALTCGRVKWDLIVSNPPYIPKNELADLPIEVRNEPRVALDGGRQGLDVIEKILNEAPFFLKKNAWLLMEIGKGQAAVLTKKIKADKRYRNLRFVKDFLGIDRILILQNVGAPLVGAQRGRA